MTRLTHSSPCARTRSRSSFCRLIENTTQPFATSSVLSFRTSPRRSNSSSGCVLHDREPVVPHRADPRPVLLDEVASQGGEGLLERRAVKSGGRSSVPPARESPSRNRGRAAQPAGRRIASRSRRGRPGAGTRAPGSPRSRSSSDAPRGRPSEVRVLEERSLELHLAQQVHEVLKRLVRHARVTWSGDRGSSHHGGRVRSGQELARELDAGRHVPPAGACPPTQATTRSRVTSGRAPHGARRGSRP